MQQILILLTAIAVTLAQVPITLICQEDCKILGTNEVANFIITYNNPKSLTAPNPWISTLELQVFDAFQPTKVNSTTFRWNRGQTTLKVPFTPSKWLSGASQIGIKAKWLESNFDNTTGGFGTVILMYIDITDSPSTIKPSTTETTGASPGSSTLVIGTAGRTPKSSGIPTSFFCPITLLLISVLYLI
jgi:hypothetical protein